MGDRARGTGAARPTGREPVKTAARKLMRWTMLAVSFAFAFVLIPGLLVGATVAWFGEAGVLHGAHGVVVGRTRSAGSARNASSSYRLHVRTDEGDTSVVSVTSSAYLDCPDGARLDIDALALTLCCDGELYSHLSLCCPFASAGLTLGWIWLIVVMVRARRATSRAP